MLHAYQISATATSAQKISPITLPAGLEPVSPVGGHFPSGSWWGLDLDVQKDDWAHMHSLATVGSHGYHMVHVADTEDHLGLGGWGAVPAVAGNHEEVGHAGPYARVLQEAVGGLDAQLVDVGLIRLLEDPWRRTSNDLNGLQHTHWTVGGNPPGR